MTQPPNLTASRSPPSTTHPQALCRLSSGRRLVVDSSLQTSPSLSARASTAAAAWLLWQIARRAAEAFRARRRLNPSPTARLPLQQEDAGAADGAALAARLVAAAPPPPAQGCRRLPGLVEGTYDVAERKNATPPPPTRTQPNKRILTRRPIPHTPTSTKVPAARGGVRHARPVVVGPLSPRSSRPLPSTKRVRTGRLFYGLEPVCSTDGVIHNSTTPNLRSILHRSAPSARPHRGRPRCRRGWPRPCSRRSRRRRVW